MPRLNTVDPARAEGKAKELFDGPLKGKHLNLFKGMANSPAALQGYLGLAGALNSAKLSGREREIIALVVAQTNECGYCLAAHTTLGKMAGLSEAETVAARRGEFADPRLTALTRFTRAVLDRRGAVSDADLKAFRDAGYTDAHVAEVVASVALNVYTNYFNRLNDTAIDFPPVPSLR